MQNKNLTHSGEIETVEQAADRLHDKYQEDEAYKSWLKNGMPMGKFAQQRISFIDGVKIGAQWHKEQSQQVKGDLKEMATKHAERWMQPCSIAAAETSFISGHQSSHTQVIELLEKRIAELSGYESKAILQPYKDECRLSMRELTNILSEFKGEK